MADTASIGHLSPPQMVVSHLRLAAICDFYNVKKSEPWDEIVLAFNASLN